MQKSGKPFNQMPEVHRLNQCGQRFYRMARMKPAFLTQRTRTWKNKSRGNFAFNRAHISMKNTKETMPAAILGTKRADELIAAQNDTFKGPDEYSRPILGRKYSIQSPEYCCEKCAKDAFLSFQVEKQPPVAMKGNRFECDVSSDAKDVDDMRATNTKIRTMTFTNKVVVPKPQQQQQQQEKQLKTVETKSVCGIETKVPQNSVPFASQPDGNGKEYKPKEIPYDMCSVLKYALKIMRSDSTDHVGDQSNSTDSQKLMAVHKRLLSMAIWNNDEEIFDESFPDIDENNENDSSEQDSGKPDTVILNSCVFFANGKSLIAPPASALPMPPKKWILDQIANQK